MKYRGCLSETLKTLQSGVQKPSLSIFKASKSLKLLGHYIAKINSGWLREWHCGVRTTKSNKLVGFISAIPATVRIYEKIQHLVEINFLCVHKKLRSKRLAPVLIKEITRRVNCKGIFQAVYTAGVVLPKPVGTCR